MKRVLILGGGFGGIAAALRLRELLPEHDEVVVVDRRPHFMVGFRKSWALVGQSDLAAGRRPLANLERRGVRVLQEPVTAIDPEGRTAEVAGQRMQADALIVALGAELAPEKVPGLQTYGYNVYDPDDIPRASQALREIRGGRVAVGIFGAPYKCPPAPYEMALLIRETLNARGVRAEVEVFTPQPMSLPVLGQAGCDVVEGHLAEAAVTFLPNHKAVSVEAGGVVFSDGERRPVDLLLGVPPHRPPTVVSASGLAQNGWVSVDARTLQTRTAGVYAVGDVVEITLANGKPLPKAGAFAEGMGRVAAEHAAAALGGHQSEAAFDGLGACFLEVGGGRARLVTGEFMATPAPKIALTDASAENLQQKQAFEAERLRAWFG